MESLILSVKGKGTFQAESCPDPDYPGIDVEFFSLEKGTTEKASRPRVLFEMYEGKPRCLIWADSNSENYTHEIVFE